MKKIVLTLFVMFFFSLTFAEKNEMNDHVSSIDLQGISIQDALHLLANQLHQDIMVSPKISGITSLHLHNMTTRQAFDLLLNSHGLLRFQQNHIWFIVPQAEFMQYKQNELKLQDIMLQTEPLVSRVWQIHYATAEDVAHVIQDEGHTLLSKRGYLHIDVRTNQICIQDIQKNMMVISQVIKRIDIPVKQVLIEARLASVDNDFERQLGINFSVRDVESQNDAQSAVSKYGIAVAALADGSVLDVKLAALENSGHGELISNPSLFTANRETASIESGEEIPYQEISSSGATGVAFKKAVLSLKVTPQVLPNNDVLLQLQINQDRPSNRIVQGVPAITTRQITTHILAKNGQTIVLGGIYESNVGDTSQGVPFLNKIPIVGLLFQQHSRVEDKRELLIFVTPKIIN